MNDDIKALEVNVNLEPAFSWESQGSNPLPLPIWPYPDVCRVLVLQRILAVIAVKDARQAAVRLSVQQAVDAGDVR